MKSTLLRRLFNFWAPFLLSGIHITRITPDWRHVRVELRMRPWNRNYVGTHFGGSLFAMTDPFWMIQIKECLGNDYIVWDKAAEIEFVKPGKGTVHAEFKVDDRLLEEIRSATAGGDKYLRWLPVQILDRQGDVVAKVNKQVYVRRKPHRRPARGEAPAD
ncbi:MAG: DUF4442 domain-containing protein [Lysobacteraceae bacterium]|nr:MAG: DUF4442 domain-containing protein [Xanthomonadaceae bacterium]